MSSLFRPIAVPLYKDADKRGSDVLTKEFPSEKQENKLTWRAETFDGVVLETTLTQKKDNSVFGTFAPKYRHRQWGVTFSGELNTKREAKAEVRVDDAAGVDGLAVILTAQELSGVKVVDPQQLVATVGTEFRHENFAFDGSVDFGKLEGSTAKAAAVAGTQGVLLGGSGVYHIGASELKEFNTSLGYSTHDYDLALYSKIRNSEGKSENDVGVKYFHQIRNDLSVAADMGFDLNNTSKTPKLTFGTNYVTAVGATYKAKFDTDGRLGLSYQQKLSKETKLTVAATVDANNLQTKNASQLGFNLNVTY